MLLRARERTLGLVAAFVALVLVVTVLVHGPAQTVRAQGGTGTIALVDTYPGLPLTSEAPSRLLHVRPVFPVPGGDAQYQTVLSERENDGPWRVVRGSGPNGTTTFDYQTSARVSPFSTFTYKAELQWRGSGGGMVWQPVATSEEVSVAWQAYRTRVMFKPEGNGQWRAVAATNGSLRSSWATMRLHQEGTATAKCFTTGHTNCTTGLLTTAQVQSADWYAQVESGHTPPAVKYRSETTPFTPIGYVPPAELVGGCNANQPKTSCIAGDPVNTATGAYWDTFTDLSLSGRGPDHAVVRAYSSGRAGQACPREDARPGRARRIGGRSRWPGQPSVRTCP